jgi:hypothetical protein
MPNNAKTQIAELKKLNHKTVNETKVSISFFEDALSKTNVYISNFTDLKQSFSNNTISLNKMNNKINELLISIKNYIDYPTRENLNLFQDKKNIIISSNREASTNLKLTYNNLSIIKNNIFEKKASFEKSIELLKNLKIKNNKFKLLMLKIKQFLKPKIKRKSIDLKNINISNLKQSNEINNNSNQSNQSNRKIFTALEATADPRCAGWREALASIVPVIQALEKTNDDNQKEILELNKIKEKEEAAKEEIIKKLDKEYKELKRLQKRIEEYNTVIVKHIEFIEENIKEINENNAILNTVYSFNSNHKTENLNNSNKLSGIMNTTMQHIKTIDNLSNLISVKEIPDQTLYNEINKLKPNIKNYQSEFNSIKNLIKTSGLVNPKTQTIIIKEFKNNLSLFDNTSSNIKNLNYGKYINEEDGEYINVYFDDVDELNRIMEVCKKLLEKLKESKEKIKKSIEDIGKKLDSTIKTLDLLRRSIELNNSLVKNIADFCF